MPKVLSPADAVERRTDLDEALASVRLEGLEPDAADLELLDALVAGRLTPDDVREQVLARYAR